MYYVLVTFQWTVTSWIPQHCPTRCGLGPSTQVRTVQCTASVGGAVPDAHCANAGPKPADTQPCQATAVCVTYGYIIIDAWSPASCPTECGLGTSSLYCVVVSILSFILCCKVMVMSINRSVP